MDPGHDKFYNDQVYWVIYKQQRVLLTLVSVFFCSLLSVLVFCAELEFVYLNFKYKKYVNLSSYIQSDLSFIALVNFSKLSLFRYHMHVNNFIKSDTRKISKQY